MSLFRAALVLSALASSVGVVIASLNLSQRAQSAEQVSPIVSKAIAEDPSLGWARFGSLLARNGTLIEEERIPISEIETAYADMRCVISASALPKKGALRWRGITNDKVDDEQLVATWRTRDATVTWSDIDRAEAHLTVQFDSELLPLQNEEELAKFLQVWLSENLQLPRPLPAQMSVFQRRDWAVNGGVIGGFVAFPDAVSNELATRLDPKLLWCRNFRFIATRTSFSLAVELNWVTTGSPMAPDGRRGSRFGGS